MKTYLQTRQRAHINLNTLIYGNFTLLLMTLLLVTMIPLFKQPTALHDLATLKTQSNTIAPIIITLYKNGEYRLNTAIEPEQTLALETIKKKLKNQLTIIDPTQISICIKCESTVTYQEIIEIIEYLQSLGVQHIGLLLN